MKVKAIAVFGALGMFALTAFGRDWHVSPKGKPDAAGTATDPVDLVTALSGRLAGAGDKVWLHGGSFKGVFRSNLRGAEGAPIEVRGWPGEHAVLEGDIAQADAAILNIFGAWTIYRDFEITNLNQQRSHTLGFRPMGIEIQAPHTTIANLVIHDTGIGIGAWDNAPDTEIYGNIIYNSGTENTSLDKRHGHAIYIQNKTGAKLIRDNVIFNNFGWGLHAYSNVGPLRQITLSGNVIFNNGIQNTSGVRYNNILVLGRGRPYSAEQIVVEDNLTYHSFDQKPGSSFSDAGVSLGCGDSGKNRNLSLKNNYFIGGTPSGLICYWDDISASDNTFVGPNGVLGLLGSAMAIGSYRWNQNHYFSAGGDTRKPQFGLNSQTFSAWEPWHTAARIDTGSTYNAARPKGVQTFVRPNSFEPGRATIVVYNWDRAETVDVDASSVLAPGARYVVRDVQDFFGEPILTGVASSSAIRLPMRQGPVAAAMGVGRTLAPTGPEFGVFVLQTESAAARARPSIAPSPRSAPQRPSPSLDGYTGNFESTKPTAQAQITLRAGKLEMKLLHEKGQPTFVLDPLEPNRFRILGAPAGYFAVFEKAGKQATRIQILRGTSSTVTLTRR